ncbi:MAG: ATP-binding protein [Chloroflexi bacterium]|nr:ATP-binding protein [Chloroflexota bacterium]
MGTVLLKDLDIQVNLMNPIPMLKISRSHLQQIIMNLIINAAEAIDSPVNGSIVLKTEKYHCSHWHKTINKVGVIKDRPSGDYLILQVSDNGKGMTPETIDNIFNPFFSTKPKGRGLGLATVRDIISAYGGYITVLSQVGEGTVFQIYFPYQPDKYASIH